MERKCGSAPFVPVNVFEWEFGEFQVPSCLEPVKYTLVHVLYMDDSLVWSILEDCVEELF